METVLEESRKQYMQLIVKPYFIFIASFAVLAVSYLFRGFVLSGQEPYFYLRLSDMILSNGIPSYDFLSFGGRAFLYPLGAPIILVILNYAFSLSIEKMIIFSPLVFGFASMVILYFILRKLKFSANVMSAVCYFVLLSPSFLYISNYFSHMTIPFFMNLAAFYFILSKKTFLRFLSLLIYLALPFFGFMHVFFGIIALFFYFKRFERISNFIPYIFVPIATFALNFRFITHFGFGVVSYEVENLISHISSFYGLSIFMIILVILGLAFVWKSGKYKYNLLYLFILINIIMLSLNQDYIIYVTLIFSFIAAYGLRCIYRMKWSSILIRNLVLIILISGIIFSGFSFINENSEAVPDGQFIDALNFLNGKTFPREVILTHEDYGVYVNTISKRKNFIDFNHAYAPRISDRLLFMEKMFQSKDLGLILDLFNEFNIKYILITPEMKSGLVWSRGDEGILYLLSNNPGSFRRIYNENGFEIWRVR